MGNDGKLDNSSNAQVFDDVESSRRNFLKTAVGGAAVTSAGAFSVLTMSGPAHGQLVPSHVWKSVALYRDSPNGRQRCAGCYHFRPPNACQIVESPISPNGWCSYWAPGVRVRVRAGGGRASRGRSGY